MGLQRVIFRIQDVKAGLGFDLRLQLRWEDVLYDEIRTRFCIEHRQISEHELHMQAEVGINLIIRLDNYHYCTRGSAVLGPYPRTTQGA